MIHAALIALGAGFFAVGAEARDVRVEHCLVSLIEEAQVPAQEAGVLTKVAVREGDQVRRDHLLAQIDDTQSQMQHQVAQLEWRVANEQATNDISVRYAAAAAKVAEAEYQEGLEANDKVSGTVPQAEIRRLLLTWRRSELQIEQAELELRVAALQTQVRQAEVEAAAQNIERRRITAPLDGVVVKTYHHVGEWVEPGDPMCHIIRMDRLRIEGFLNSAAYSPAEVDRRPITVRVKLTGGREEQFTGKVVFVSPQDQAGGEFRIWAEVLNRMENDHWLLRPGAVADMTIHLGR